MLKYRYALKADMEYTEILDFIRNHGEGKEHEILDHIMDIYKMDPSWRELVNQRLWQLERNGMYTLLGHLGVFESVRT